MILLHLDVIVQHLVPDFLALFSVSLNHWRVLGSALRFVVFNFFHGPTYLLLLSCPGWQSFILIGLPVGHERCLLCLLLSGILWTRHVLLQRILLLLLLLLLLKLFLEGWMGIQLMSFLAQISDLRRPSTLVIRKIFGDVLHYKSQWRSKPIWLSNG